MDMLDCPLVLRTSSAPDTGRVRARVRAKVRIMVRDVVIHLSWDQQPSHRLHQLCTWDSEALDRAIRVGLELYMILLQQTSQIPVDRLAEMVGSEMPNSPRKIMRHAMNTANFG